MRVSNDTAVMLRRVLRGRRYESVRHLKWVDEVIEDAPWVVTEDFLDQHQVGTQGPARHIMMSSPHRDSGR